MKKTLPRFQYCRNERGDVVVDIPTYRRLVVVWSLKDANRDVSHSWLKREAASVEFERNYRVQEAGR